MHIVRCGITRRQNIVQKEAEKKLKYKSLGIEITTNVEPEMYDFTGKYWEPLE